jgi:hypothetical protein
VSGVEVKFQQGQLGTVHERPISGGGQQIEYKAPTGSASTSRLAANRFSVRVERPVDVGTRGQRRVVQIVLAVLRAEGVEVEELPAEDARGEDAVLQIAGERVTLQIVAATPPNFWEEVAKGSSEADVPVRDAVSWINDAIAQKAAMYPAAFRASMLLLVDVDHMGPLASAGVRAEYLQSHGDPAVVHQFGGVWLVGPTENNVGRLGRNRW